MLGEADRAGMPLGGIEAAARSMASGVPVAHTGDAAVVGETQRRGPSRVRGVKSMVLSRAVAWERLLTMVPVHRLVGIRVSIGDSKKAIFGWPETGSCGSWTATKRHRTCCSRAGRRYGAVLRGGSSQRIFGERLVNAVGHQAGTAASPGDTNGK